jgi:hypothetical protein
MMTLIEDLGWIYPTSESKHKARMGIYECTKCKAHVKCYTAHVERTNREFCADCGSFLKASAPFTPAKQEDYAMRIVEDLGRVYKTPESKVKSHLVVLECVQCKKHVVSSACSTPVKEQKYCLRCSNGYNNVKHGDCTTRLYSILKGMIRRCYGKTCKSNNNTDYLAKGITVCDEWRNDYEAFKKWSMENGYTAELTIDRINNDLGYFPENCRWATRAVQARNTKVLGKNNTTGYRGVSMHTKSKKYRARITVDYKEILIGTFDDPYEAALAYDRYIIDNNLEHSTNGLV